MNPEYDVQRRRQFCSRCGQLMFEYFRSPDGHFGLLDSLKPTRKKESNREISCAACGARYCFLERLNAMGEPIERRLGRKQKAFTLGGEIV
jgi:hypothetical protein